MHLSSINLGQKRQLLNGSKLETTGIHKIPVDGPVAVTKYGIEHDFIASKKHHGGPDQAVYIYGADDYAWWSEQLGSELAPGTFGENLTINGLESARFNIGDRLRISEVTLQVTAPRIPCGTFAARMKDPGFVKRFSDAERPGLYCRVLQEGTINTGDIVKSETYESDRISIVDVYREYYNRNRSAETIRKLLASPIAERLRTKLEGELD